MQTLHDELLFMLLWTSMSVGFAFYGWWRLQKGQKERRFRHLFYEVTERKAPFRFKYELVFMYVWAGMASMFVVIGLIWTMSLLIELMT
jgi:hypothetical protein